MDQGEYDQEELDLIYFLEWLDAEDKVLLWSKPETHEEVVLSYLEMRDRL